MAEDDVSSPACRSCRCTIATGVSSVRPDCSPSPGGMTPARGTVLHLELTDNIAQHAGPGHPRWSWALGQGMNELLVHLALLLAGILLLAIGVLVLQAALALLVLLGQVLLLAVLVLTLLIRPLVVSSWAAVPTWRAGLNRAWSLTVPPAHFLRSPPAGAATHPPFRPLGISQDPTDDPRP